MSKIDSFFNKFFQNNCRNSVRSVIFYNKWKNISKELLELLKKIFQDNFTEWTEDKIDEYIIIISDPLKQLIIDLDNIVLPSFVDEMKKAIEKEELNEYENYLSYIQQKGRSMCEERMLNLLNTYGLMWLNNYSDAINRLFNDQEEIRELLGGNGDMVLKNISDCQSDSHNNGKRVVIISLNWGKVVYKPTNNTLGHFLGKVLEILNLEQPFDLKTPQYVDREDYHWSSFVEYRESSSFSQVQNFYKRCGVFLGLATVFSLTDAHFENIIIGEGEYPILIDSETLLSPLNNEKRESNVQELKFGFFNTNLIQMEPSLEESYSSWTGAFQHQPSSNLNSLSPAVFREGTSSISISYSYQSDVETKSKAIPFIGGKYFYLSSFVDEFIQGLNLIREKIIENEISLRSLLSKYSKTRVRIIPRPTLRYLNWLRYYLAHFNHLETDDFTLFGKASADLKRLEFDQVSKLDIPFFHYLPSRHCVLSGNHEIQNFKVNRNAFEQFEIILDVFKDKTSFNNAIKEIAHESLSKDVFNDYNLSENGMVRQSINYLKQLNIHKQVLRKERNKYLSFHDGISGIIVAFSALYKCTQQETVKNVCDELKTEIVKMIREQEITLEYGGTVGLTSVMYGMSLCYEILNDDTYLDVCEMITEMLSNDKILSDQNLDVFTGTAGCLLTLTRMIKINKKKGRDVTRLEELASTATKHLMDNIKIEGDFSFWKTNFVKTSGQCLTGFSHGQSGIAFALLEMYDFSKREELLNHALRALKYEDSKYSEYFCNWPDYRDQPEDINHSNIDQNSNKFAELFDWYSYCHGSGGMFMTRLHPHVPEDFRKNSTEIIKKIIQKITEFDNGNSICCGDFGLMAILFTYANKVNDKVLQERVKQLGFKSVKRCFVNGPNISSDVPSLLSGLSGLSYQLLKFVDPTLPCFLNWGLW